MIKTNATNQMELLSSLNGTTLTFNTAPANRTKIRLEGANNDALVLDGTNSSH